MTKRHAPPKAGAMIEALRGLGYTTASAIADIIDNSIAAKASRIDLSFVWQNEQSRIEILDNGCGMDSCGLDTAMRLGELNPQDKRDESDLGRFGMGMKTASFSQCRSLTVATIQDCQFNCLRWDLDELAKNPGDGWFMLEGPSASGQPIIEYVKSIPNGTLVLWEKLDRIISDGFTSENFLDLIDQVEHHLAMVFHRYLEDKDQRFEIYINNNKIKPWDPFMCGHPAKSWNSPLASLPTQYGTVNIECHVLPHKDRLTDKEYQSAGGPDGWTAQQGFYVYRNKRLLLAGSWLGLGKARSWTKEEAHKLARIKLDIPNTMDSDWKIDIRKATARPPVKMRKWLMRLAEDTRARARKTFASRGRPAVNNAGQTLVQAWRADQTKSGVRYRVDFTHPAVKAVFDDAGSLLPQIKVMLRILEETIPVQRIWLDTAENKETPRTNFDGEAPSEIVEVLTIMFQNLTNKKGFSVEEAKIKLLQTEPFYDYPHLVASLAKTN